MSSPAPGKSASDGNSNSPLLHDAERDAGDYFAAAPAAENGEDTPLLPTDLPADVIPDKTFQRSVIAMAYIFIALIDIYAFLIQGPVQQVMEDIICHRQYPDHIVNQPRVQDQRCKEPEVQRTLAMVRGWWASVEQLIRERHLSS